MDEKYIYYDIWGQSTGHLADRQWADKYSGKIPKYEVESPTQEDYEKKNQVTKCYSTTWKAPKTLKKKYIFS